MFGFLRLPVSLSRFDGSAEPDSPASLRFGLRATFDLLAVVALLQALFLAWALPSGLEGEDLPIEPTDATPPPLSASIREAGSKLVEGFRLAAQDGNIALGFASSFASRAQTTVTNAFLPLLIERVRARRRCGGEIRVLTPRRPGSTFPNIICATRQRVRSCLRGL